MSGKSQFQHHVPRFYLNGWSTTVARIPKRVWVYTKEAKPRHAAIKTTGGRPDMYAVVRADGTVDLETVESFIAKVESRAGKIFPKIQDRKRISFSDKRDLALFLSVMYRRGPYTLDVFAPMNLAPMIPQLHEEMKEHALGSSADPETQRIRLEAVDKAILLVQNNVPSVTSQAILLSSRMAEFFATCSWGFFCSESAKFVTSDCPIVFDRFRGIRDPHNGHILFPISNKIVLLMSPLIRYPYSYTRIPESLVSDLNKRIIWNSFCEVYSDHFSEEIEEYTNQHIGKGLPREAI